MHQLPAFLDGDLDGLIDALVAHFDAEKLKDTLEREARTPAEALASAPERPAPAGR